jgi:hypothetical protein
MSICGPRNLMDERERMQGRYEDHDGDLGTLNLEMW